MPSSPSLPTDKPLEIPAIAAALGDLARRFDIDLIDRCDSTNSRLLARADTGAASGSVLVSRCQTAGRGRRGRPWLSAPDDSLTFSLLWRFPRGAALDGLSLAVGVAIARTLESLGAEAIALKWPNDILCADRKLAGILIELSSTPQQIGVIIGIGLNLRLPPEMPEDLRLAATALDATNCAHLDPNQLLAQLLRNLHALLQQFATDGFSAVREDWLNRHAYNDQMVTLLTDFAAPVSGRCRGVARDGALLLETAQGIQRIISGEVSLRKDV